MTIIPFNKLEVGVQLAALTNSTGRSLLVDTEYLKESNQDELFKSQRTERDSF